MAKKKSVNKIVEKSVSKLQKKRTSDSRMFLIFSLVVGVVVIPTSLLLFVGMLPTIACVFATRGKRTKVVTVGAMNLAGCSPFLLDLWTKQHNLESSVEIVSDPWAIVVMYASASVGYLLDWATEGLVVNFMYQKAGARQKQILKRKKELVERWGKKVSGKFPLDKSGFPIGDYEDESVDDSSNKDDVVDAS
ncbi:hypothetical protein N9Z27_01625 [Alphaproteobacteria bacterium]|nr:hypothetical protein [Alphaproteobacteria bacterium]